MNGVLMPLGIVSRLFFLVTFIGATYLLFENFATNKVHSGKPREFETFQADSQDLLVRKLELVRRGDSKNSWPYLIKKEGDPYTAQVGLQARVFLFFGLDAGSVPEYIRLAETIVAFISALVFSGYIVAVGTRFGLSPMLVTFLGIYSSEWIVLISKNIYWVSFLFFLPFLWSWCAYERLVYGGKQGWFYCGLTFLVAVKALCGYEYVTNIILGAVLPILFYESRAGRRLFSLRGPVTRGVASGVVGVLAAMILHVIIGMVATGSLSEGVSMILNPARYRTIDYSSFQVYDQAATMGLVSSVERYFGLVGLRLYLLQSDPWVIEIGALIFFGLALSVIGFFLGLSNQYTNLKSYSLVVGLSIPATLSWALLAKGHMFFHLHLNGIIFYYPFLLLLFPLIGMFISFLIIRLARAGFSV